MSIRMNTEDVIARGREIGSHVEDVTALQNYLNDVVNRQLAELWRDAGAYQCHRPGSRDECTAVCGVRSGSRRYEPRLGGGSWSLHLWQITRSLISWCSRSRR